MTIIERSTCEKCGKTTTKCFTFFIKNRKRCICFRCFRKKLWGRS